VRVGTYPSSPEVCQSFPGIGGSMRMVQERLSKILLLSRQLPVDLTPSRKRKRVEQFPINASRSTGEIRFRLEKGVLILVRFPTSSIVMSIPRWREFDQETTTFIMK